MAEQMKDNRNPGVALTNINPVMFIRVKKPQGPGTSANPTAPPKTDLPEPAHLCKDKFNPEGLNKCSENLVSYILLSFE